MLSSESPDAQNPARDIARVRIFGGAERRSLDEKGRITIPARWRAGAQGGFYVIKDPRKNALGLLLDFEMQALLERLQTLPALSGEAGRAFRRNYFSRARECPVDKQGRMVLPPDLCAEAGLSGEVELIGTGERIEIWSPENWEAEKVASEFDFKTAVETLGL